MDQVLKWQEPRHVNYTETCSVVMEKKVQINVCFNDMMHIIL